MVAGDAARVVSVDFAFHHDMSGKDARAQASNAAVAFNKQGKNFDNMISSSTQIATNFDNMITKDVRAELSFRRRARTFHSAIGLLWYGHKCSRSQFLVL